MVQGKETSNSNTVYDLLINDIFNIKLIDEIFLLIKPILYSYTRPGFI